MAVRWLNLGQELVPLVSHSDPPHPGPKQKAGLASSFKPHPNPRDTHEHAYTLTHAHTRAHTHTVV